MRPLTIAEFSGVSIASRASATAKFASAASAKASNVATAFLCHSHKDRILALQLIALLAAKGVDLYVDWMDSDMPATPTRETAEKIQRKIQDLDFFLYLATPNSGGSKWCPWEIGYGDKAKGKDRLYIIPTQHGTTVSGQEYLSLYRSLQVNTLQKIVEWDPITRKERPWVP
jgi:hypothetical protein